MKKLTRKNYKKLIDIWSNGDDDNRKVSYIFIGGVITVESIIEYSFEKNIVVRITDYEDNYKKIEYQHHLK